MKKYTLILLGLFILGLFLIFSGFFDSPFVASLFAASPFVASPFVASLFVTSLKEGFVWSDELKKRFDVYQKTENDNRNQYNIDILQQQASPEEAEQLLATGYWSWSDDTAYQYMDSVWRNKVIKMNVSEALDYAKKTYNETAAKALLSWNAKEGEFLLYGGKGRDNNTIIKCSSDENNGAVMQKIIKNPNSPVPTVVPIDNAFIPYEMPGFSFIKKDKNKKDEDDENVCNPCVALHGDYSCPFTLKMKGDENVSDIWFHLWKG